MTIKIGADSVIDLYVGSSPVQEVYKGSSLIWSRLPNINFPGAWNSGAAQAFWVASWPSDFSHTAIVTAGYQQTRRYVYFDGSAVFSVGGQFQMADYVTLQPGTNYNLVMDVTVTESSASGGFSVRTFTTGVGITGGGTLSFPNQTTGTLTIPFTTNSGGDVGLQIRHNAYIDGGQAVGNGRTYRVSRAVIEYR